MKIAIEGAMLFIGSCLFSSLRKFIARHTVKFLSLAEFSQRLDLKAMLTFAERAGISRLLITCVTPKKFFTAIRPE